MSKIAILNDTHCGIRNSSDIFLDNAAKFYNETFFPYCVDKNIKQIIHLGDYYDNRKHLNVKSLYRNRKDFIEPMIANGMMMDIIPGNHDTYFKNTNEINSLKEALGFFINDINIIQKPQVIEYGKTRIALIPWINQENYDQTMNFISKCNADILGGHLELNGFEMMRGVTNTHGMDSKMFERFELVLSGHFHTRSSRDNVVYLGSQLEFFWSDAHDDKFFHVLDTETRELTKIQNPHRLFEKVVYNDSKVDYTGFDYSIFDHKFVKVVVVEKNDTYLFDKFIDNIQKRAIHELKIAENFNEFLGDNVTDSDVYVEDTSTLLNNYIDAVETDLDKHVIKTEISELLKQAQTLEIQ